MAHRRVRTSKGDDPMNNLKIISQGNLIMNVAIGYLTYETVGALIIAAIKETPSSRPQELIIRWD